MINVQQIIFNGIKISLLTNDNTHKTTIVFIHGNSMSKKIWKKQFSSKLSERYNLIALDLPGHGESENLTSYDLHVLSTCISSVVTSLSLQNYFLVGNSLGGDLILQELNKLDNCKGIVLVDTPPISLPPAIDKSFLPNPLVGMFFAKDYEKENLVALSQILFNNINNIPDFIISDFERTDGIIRQALAEAVGSGSYIDEIEVLKKNTIPVAIFTGENEKMVNNDYFLSLVVPMLWGKKTAVVKNSAHCPQWENDIDFNELLENFIKSVGV